MCNNVQRSIFLVWTMSIYLWRLWVGTLAKLRYMCSHKTTIPQATAPVPTQPSRTHSSPGAKHNGFLSRPFNECWDVPFFAASAFLSTRIAQFVLLLLTLLMASACLCTPWSKNNQPNRKLTNQTKPTQLCKATESQILHHELPIIFPGFFTNNSLEHFFCTVWRNLKWSNFPQAEKMV